MRILARDANLAPGPATRSRRPPSSLFRPGEGRPPSFEMICSAGGLFTLRLATARGPVVMRRVLPVIFAWVVLATSSAEAQNWVAAVFPERAFDFGTVARGSKLRHSFKVVNRRTRRSTSPTGEPSAAAPRSASVPGYSARHPDVVEAASIPPSSRATRPRA